MDRRRDINIHVPVLARVEGEGALEVIVREGRIEDLKLRIFEPPRLFEKFLEGRDYTEVLDIVARICGICPVAYQMSAVHAIESVFALHPGEWVRGMRRVLYCGEWIQSHALHIHLLAAPDFLGYDSAVAMAADHADIVRRGLRLQALGNSLIRLLGGRSVHPVGACVGGFFRAPTVTDVEAMREALAASEQDAAELVQWAAALALPGEQQTLTTVSLRHDSEYPMNEGRLVSSDGLDIDIAEYQAHFSEQQVAHSTALHSSLNGRPYLVGPLARLNHNLDRLPAAVQDVVATLPIRFPSGNVFHSIVARAIELHCAIVEAQRLLADYRVPESPRATVISPRAGRGYGCTEAPRGTLWHAYDLGEDGRVESATIVPPTSQNQARIEQDLRHSLEAFGLEHDDDAIRRHGETVIRNYDPCISCATHFLQLKVERL